MALAAVTPLEDVLPLSSYALHTTEPTATAIQSTTTETGGDSRRRRAAGIPHGGVGPTWCAGTSRRGAAERSRCCDRYQWGQGA